MPSLIRTTFDRAVQQMHPILDHLTFLYKSWKIIAGFRCPGLSPNRKRDINFYIMHSQHGQSNERDSGLYLFICLSTHSNILIEKLLHSRKLECSIG